MGMTNQYIKMLSANDTELSEIIDKMTEKQAKDMLKLLIKNDNRARKDSIGFMLGKE